MHENTGHEGERILSKIICQYLSSEQFITETAFDFDSGVGKIFLYDFTCISPEITLAHGSGLDILRPSNSTKRIKLQVL